MEEINISLSTKREGNIPCGLWANKKGTNAYFPAIYFRKPKGIKDEEYETYLKILKEIFEQDIEK
jgi:hypothetical protein